LDELRSLHTGVTAAARAALSVNATDPKDMPEELEEAAIRHALERLEATLRARAAEGFTAH
jgi:hypothetical protein